MRRMTVAMVVAALCVAGAAGAQDSSAAMDAIKTRQAAFNLSGVAMGSMKAAIDAGGSVRSQTFAARALSRWAHALPGAFPAGTDMIANPGATKATPEIWSDRAGFEAKAADYAAAADRLAELAQADDAAGFAAQWATVRQTCGACHTAYRAD
jgi:cytochrome c556